MAENTANIEIESSEPRGKDLIQQEIDKLKSETGDDTPEVQVVSETEENTPVEVEAPEEKTDEPVIETKEEEPKEEKPKDNFKTHSKDVQRRINTLVRQKKEAEEREAALQARLAKLEQSSSQTESRYNVMQNGYYNEFKQRVETQHALAKDNLKKAYENNDADQIIAAQELLSKATLDKERLALATAEREQMANQPQEQPVNPVANTMQQPSQDTAPPPPDPRAKAWAESNPWFGSDEAMTYTAFSIHKKLLEEEGFDPNSDEYYNEIDARIKSEFPHKFENEQPAGDTSSKPRVVQPVASVKRGTTNNARKVIRLTPRQIQTAKNLGVPLKEYAKHIKE